MARPQSPTSNRATTAAAAGAGTSTFAPGKRLLFLSLQCLLLAGVVQGRIGSDSAVVEGNNSAASAWQNVLRRLQGFTTETTTINSQPQKAQVGFASPAIPREKVDANYLNAYTQVPAASKEDKEAQQSQAYRNSDFDIDSLAANDLDNVEAQILSALTAVPANPASPGKEVAAAAQQAPSRNSGLGAVSPEEHNAAEQANADANAAAAEAAEDLSLGASSNTAVPIASSTIGSQIPVAPQVLQAQPVPQPADNVQLMSSSAANVNNNMASPAQNLNNMKDAARPIGSRDRPPPPFPQQLGQQQEVPATTELGQAQEILPTANAQAQEQKQDAPSGSSPTRSSSSSALPSSAAAANEAVVPQQLFGNAAHTQVPWEELHKKITTHCEMTVHFFDGHSQRPTPQEVSSLMFETTRYFTDVLTADPETRDVFVGFTATNVAVLPNLLSDPATTFRCDFDFGVQVVEDAIHRITLNTVHGIIDGADFPQFIQDYIWLSPPLQENQFYQTHGVALKCFDDAR